MRGLRQLPVHEGEFSSAAAVDGKLLAVGLRLAPRFLAETVEAEIVNQRSLRRCARRAIGVEADKQIGLVVVRNRRAGVRVRNLVFIARHDDANAEAPFDGAFHALRDCEHHILFHDAVRPLHAGVVATVTRIQHDRAD